MQISPINNNKQQSPNFKAIVADKTLNAIKSQIHTKSGMRALNKQLKRINALGDKNTEVTIYHGSTRTFYVCPDSEITRNQISALANGTYMSFKNKLFPQKDMGEHWISNESLELNSNILKIIDKQAIEQFENFIGIPKTAAPKTKFDKFLNIFR